MLRHLRTAAVAALVLAAASVSAQDGNVCFSCTRALPLVTPVPLLPYTDGLFSDFRPAINATATTIVFERQVFDATTGYYGTVNLYIADLASHHVVALAPGVPGSARADWCWRPEQPRADGPITFSQALTGPVFIMPPRAGAPTRQVPGTLGTVYPTWYPSCRALALDADATVSGPSSKGPSTLKVDAQTGALEKSATGSTLWAGFPSVNAEKPNLVAFAGQQFTLNNPAAACQGGGYDENCNYIYIADSTETPPRVYPLDRNAPVNSYNPDYEGRAPTWSPDGRWIAFESNRMCIKGSVSNAALYQIYIQDSRGFSPARAVTDCMYNAQHAKWYRRPVGGRNLLIVTVLAFPGPPDGVPGHLAARKISSLDVTAFVAR